MQSRYRGHEKILAISNLISVQIHFRAAFPVGLDKGCLNELTFVLTRISTPVVSTSSQGYAVPGNRQTSCMSTCRMKFRWRHRWLFPSGRMRPRGERVADGWSVDVERLGGRWMTSVDCKVDHEFPVKSTLCRRGQTDCNQRQLYNYTTRTSWCITVMIVPWWSQTEGHDGWEFKKRQRVEKCLCRFVIKYMAWIKHIYETVDKIIYLF